MAADQALDRLRPERLGALYVAVHAHRGLSQARQERLDLSWRQMSAGSRENTYRSSRSPWR